MHAADSPRHCTCTLVTCTKCTGCTVSSSAYFCVYSFATGYWDCCQGFLCGNFTIGGGGGGGCKSPLPKVEEEEAVTCSKYL